MQVSYGCNGRESEMQKGNYAGIFVCFQKGYFTLKAVEEKMPIIVVRGSNFSDNLIHMLKFPENDYQEWNEVLEKGLFHILEKTSSDEIASYIHLLLNFTPT